MNQESAVAEVTPESLAQQNAKILKELADMRRDMNGMRRERLDDRQIVLELGKMVRNLDRRLSEQTSELETILKMEISGRFAHFETSIMEQIEDFATRIGAVESHLNL
jgi:flagellar biosynthesis GTPase FlhF